jgi:hypothetical protein
MAKKLLVLPRRLPPLGKWKNNKVLLYALFASTLLALIKFSDDTAILVLHVLLICATYVFESNMIIVLGFSLLVVVVLKFLQHTFQEGLENPVMSGDQFKVLLNQKMIAVRTTMDISGNSMQLNDFLDAIRKDVSDASLDSFSLYSRYAKRYHDLKTIGQQNAASKADFDWVNTNLIGKDVLDQVKLYYESQNITNTLASGATTTSTAGASSAGASSAGASSAGASSAGASSAGASSAGASSAGASSVGASSVGASSVGASSVGASSVGASSNATPKGVEPLVGSEYAQDSTQNSLSQMIEKLKQGSPELKDAARQLNSLDMNEVNKLINSLNMMVDRF